MSHIETVIHMTPQQLAVELFRTGTSNLEVATRIRTIKAKLEAWYNARQPEWLPAGKTTDGQSIPNENDLAQELFEIATSNKDQHVRLVMIRNRLVGFSMARETLQDPTSTKTTEEQPIPINDLAKHLYALGSGELPMEEAVAEIRKKLAGLVAKHRTDAAGTIPIGSVRQNVSDHEKEITILRRKVDNLQRITGYKGRSAREWLRRLDFSIGKIEERIEAIDSRVEVIEDSGCADCGEAEPFPGQEFVSGKFFPKEPDPLTDITMKYARGKQPDDEEGTCVKREYFAKGKFIRDTVEMHRGVKPKEDPFMPPPRVIAGYRTRGSETIVDHIGEPAAKFSDENEPQGQTPDLDPVWDPSMQPPSKFTDESNPLEDIRAGIALAKADVGLKPTPTLDFIFDGPPSREGPRLIEVEVDGVSQTKAGEWIEREDGLWQLSIRTPYVIERHPFSPTVNKGADDTIELTTAGWTKTTEREPKPEGFYLVAWLLTGPFLDDAIAGDSIIDILNFQDPNSELEVFNGWHVLNASPQRAPDYWMEIPGVPREETPPIDDKDFEVKEDPAPDTADDDWARAAVEREFNNLKPTVLNGKHLIYERDAVDKTIEIVRNQHVKMRYAWFDIKTDPPEQEGHYLVVYLGEGSLARYDVLHFARCQNLPGWNDGATSMPEPQFWAELPGKPPATKETPSGK